MFEINKQQFGSFIAMLRKEKGYTQKELAQRLFISDKAVSKWETAVSIPDTALLIPLSDLLGVSVTELLMCERIKDSNPLDAGQVEGLVKTAISYSGDHTTRAYQNKSKWKLFYAAACSVKTLVSRCFWVRFSAHTSASLRKTASRPTMTKTVLPLTVTARSA